MKKLGLFTCSAFAATLLLTVATQASVPLDRTKRKPMFVTLPSRGVTANMLATQATAAVPESIPFFASQVTSPLDGNTYSFQIVGTNPSNNKVSTTIKYLPIMLRIHFADGTVLDPTKPGCNDTVSVEQRFFGSPLFHSTPLRSNGVAVGDIQVIDAFQRAPVLAVREGKQLPCSLECGSATSARRCQCSDQLDHLRRGLRVRAQYRSDQHK